jgi:hypothetical protein
MVTRSEAEAKLVELGFTYTQESHEWVRGEERGRIAWVPSDYDDPQSEPQRIWLMHPVIDGVRLLDLPLVGETAPPPPPPVAAPTERSALICDRCGTEIKPGSEVEFIGPDPTDPDTRILLEGEALIVHATCPEPDPAIQS